MSELAPRTSPTALWREIERLNSELNALYAAISAVAAQSNKQILAGTGNPNGVVTATGPAIYLDNTNPTAPVQYIKSTTGTSNNEWV